MNDKMPDPKEVVDSIVDGAIEIAEAPVRVADNIARVAGTFSSEVKANMDTIKSKLPDSPEALPEVAITAARQTLKAGIGLFKGIGQGLEETVEAVENQIGRIAR